MKNQKLINSLGLHGLQRQPRLQFLGCFLSFVLISTLTACSNGDDNNGDGGGGDGGGDGGGGDVTNRSLPLADYSPLVLSAGVPETVVGDITFDVIDRTGPFESIQINTSELTTLMVSGLTEDIPGLQQLADLFIAKALAQTSDTLEVTFYVGRTELGDRICTDGEQYGPFTASVASGVFSNFSVDSVEATQSTVDVVNTGNVRICAVLTASTSMTIDMDDQSIDNDVSCTEEPVDISGTWNGTYSCGGDCPEGGEVSLTITQNGQSASYTDESGASYTGNVCGSRFSFSGGLTGSYRESGTFVINSDNTTAFKNSTWTDLVSSCGSGNECSDELTREP